MELLKKLAPIEARYSELSALLSEGTATGDKFVKMTKEYSDLTPVIETITAYKKALTDKDDLEAMIDDPEMGEIAREELYELNGQIPELEHKIKLTLIPKDTDDDKNAILEIRAGTGGDEAALFAGNLLVMYKAYALERGWRFEIVEATENDIGGMKDVVVEITGSDVFSRLKYESGVHRVQRVPETEASGRVHTSAATVAVLPEAEDVDVGINDGDLRIDVYRSRGAGGQSVNTTDSAVRITHLPTGLVVAMQDERSQIKNRAKAMKILKSRLYDLRRQEIANERAADRKSQVGSGDRSERIRTYNYPQSRVTDHRINLTLYKIHEIMAGKGLDEIIDALTTEEQAEKLAALGM
ncbi:MAG: peptide chain release factor 1 [Alphaproteobacteria bacterium]|nr:peptide chain release factor 1 [Alphaproteobacteria bacterium]OIN86995.1 MAG: peptide chain release factor 1 [Alphaproteobacteria bacterium CG1_02_46_17]